MSKEFLFHIVFSVVLHHGLGSVNFALHKSAVQSTTFNGTFLWSADKAVDGNLNGRSPDDSRTCSATKHEDSAIHTWEVDLGLQIIVKTITVYGRIDGATDQLYGVKLYLGNTSKPWIHNQEIPSNSSNYTLYVFTPNDVIAKVISLMRRGIILTLCEVTVEGDCLDGMFSEFCNKTCGKCIAGQTCDKETGTCPLGCDAAFKGTLCEKGCERGNYGYNCNESCGNCLNGNHSCSTSDGNCSNGCKLGWQGYDCKRGTLGSVTPVDVGPNAGVIVGSVLAAVGVSIFAMVIITVIVKNRRKRDNNKTSTEMVTTSTHYANSVVGNPDAACKITVGSRAEKKTTFSDIVEANLHNRMPTVTTDSHSGIKELDVPVHNDYEKLRDVTGSIESAYSTIDHSLTNDQRKEVMENCSNYVETLQSLESALKSVEEEISVLLNRKEKLLCKELERANANKLRDKRKKKDCTQSDTDNDYTDVNDQRIGDLEHCGNYVQMLQSVEGELRLLEEKRKCFLERKENLLLQELAKTTEKEK